MMLNAISIQILVILVVITVVAIGILPKVIAQSSNSNTTIRSDHIGNLFSKAPPSIITQDSQVNHYSAWLFICKAPPITDLESQCDAPIQLH